MKTRLLSSIVFILLVFSLSSVIFAVTPVNIVYPELREINNVKVINSQIEACEDIQLSVINGGILEAVNVRIGDYVEKGQTLFVFEQDNIRSQLQQAEAAVEIAEANLIKAQKGASEEQLRAAEAGVRQAEAAVKIARANHKILKDGASSEDRANAEAAYQQAVASFEGAKSSLELLEEIYDERRMQKQQLISAESQLNSAENQVKLAEENLEQALTGLEQARKEFERTEYLYQEGVVTENQFEMVENQYKNTRSAVESARLAKEQADIGYQAAKENYILAEDNYNNPTELEQQLSSARTQLEIARANKQMAKANLEKLKKGAREGELEIAQGNVEQAEAALESVRAQFEELKIGASEEDILIAEANLKQARAGLQLTRKALEDSVLKSPINGIIAGVNYAPGELVAPGTPAVNIVNLDKVYIRAQLTENQINRVEKGQQLTARILAYDSYYLDGTVEHISPVVDPRTQAFTVKLLADNPDSRLKGGMFAELYLPGDERKEALVLPLSAVIDLEDPHVFVLDNGRAIKTPVEIGIIYNDYLEITAGLKQGQPVITAGHNNLNNGDPVEVID